MTTRLTTFTAVREEFLVHPVGTVKDYDSLCDAFIDIFDDDIMKARYLKCRGFDCLGTECLTRNNILEDVKKIKKNWEKGKIIARHSGDVMVLA
ncbi:hypothetical protein EVAR_84542_1 [Eumeta japonica]|uniref:Uncharacterized protein n=1 Tax=Eumeta variegata TaxID=151549 RepID=A0A4C1UHM3_EUMVA|nr:hypothetical protein EVAR_84542_1 [Eumeta japonica]